MTRRREPEHVEQRAFFHWAALHEARLPELWGLFAVPNGRKRNPAEAGKLRAEGVKPGVPDVLLPVPRAGYTGLAIEFKAPGEVGRVSPEQYRWHSFLKEQGWCVTTVDSWREGWNVLIRYLDRADLAQPLVGGVA